MSKVQIAIVDDHAILRFGLKKMVNSIDNLEITIEASNGKEFIDMLSTTKPDLVIMDINMPIMNGEEAIKLARKIYPDLKILVLSMNNDEKHFKTMNSLNVDGYIIKESEFDELERAISVILKGGKFFSQELLLNMINGNSPALNLEFTKRETEVLGHLCNGLSTNDIAAKLFISPRTVEKHRADLFLKTDTNTSIGLVVFAFKNGLAKI